MPVVLRTGNETVAGNSVVSRIVAEKLIFVVAHMTPANVIHCYHNMLRIYERLDFGTILFRLQWVIWIDSVVCRLVGKHKFAPNIGNHLQNIKSI